MPAIVVPLSVLGLVPFVGFGLAALSNTPEQAEHGLVALIDYAALVLAFSGGLHWGLALIPGAVRPTLRILAGVLPMIVAWAGVVLAQMVSPSVALAVLILGYLATVLSEHKAAQRFVVPSRFVWVRWGFSGVAVLAMAVVLVCLGIGQTVVL